MKNPPRTGYCTPVNIIRVIDGDTLEVEVSRRFAVRLTKDGLDGSYFDVSEKDTPKGEQATEFVSTVIMDGREFLLFIPTGMNDKLMDINSFNRILGEIWVDGTPLTDKLLEAGYGKLRKK